MRSPRIVWFAIARAPYHDFFFGKLAERTRLTVVYAEKGPSHPWRLDEPGHDARYLGDGLGFSLRAAWSADAVVFQGWNSLPLVALMAALPPGTPKAFWTDTPRTDRKGGWRQRVRDAVMAGVFWRFDQVWSTGQTGCQALVALNCPPAKVRSLPFFTDLDAYVGAGTDARASAAALRRERRVGDDAVIFLASGRLAPNKRVGDAIEALARLPDRAVLWVAGDGLQFEAWKALARRLGVESRVHFLGWVQPGELGRLLLAVDVLVHAAEGDPFPNVVLEAMAWARPVVGSTGAGSVTDRVTHGLNGLLFEPGDVDTLTLHMRRFVDDVSLAARFGEAARRTACEHPFTEGLEVIEGLTSLARRRAD